MPLNPRHSEGPNLIVPAIIFGPLDPRPPSEDDHYDNEDTDKDVKDGFNDALDRAFWNQLDQADQAEYDATDEQRAFQSPPGRWPHQL